METLKKCCIIFLSILATLLFAFIVYPCLSYTTDPEKLFTFELRTTEQGESYYAVTGYIGQSQRFDFMTATIPAEYKGLPVYEISDKAFYSEDRYYKTEIKRIKIADGIKKIGNFAFCKTDLVEIIIPDSVESIGEHAFFSCSQLKKIVLPSNLQIIPAYAFAHCRALEDITIPTSVYSIEEKAFYYCLSINNILIPDGVISIGEEAFYKCDVLNYQRLRFSAFFEVGRNNNSRRGNLHSRHHFSKLHCPQGNHLTLYAQIDQRKHL